MVCVSCFEIWTDASAGLNSEFKMIQYLKNGDGQVCETDMYLRLDFVHPLRLLVAIFLLKAREGQLITHGVSLSHMKR